MKSALFSLALLLACATALAATTELRPAGPATGTYRWQCAATGFRDAQTIAGVCMERQYGAGSGRGGGYRQPILVGIWATTWDYAGAPTVDFSTTATWPGCQGTQSVVEVNGTYYYFIAADSLGDELVENYCVSYLVTP
jgi:hypothetical protein